MLNEALRSEGEWKKDVVVAKRKGCPMSGLYGKKLLMKRTVKKDTQKGYYVNKNISTFLDESKVN